MTFEEAQNLLDQMTQFGIKLGLDNINRLLAVCGAPQDKLKFIHLAGTNGKGSTGSLLHASLVNCGYKVGFYTSPHLTTVRERLRINGEAISEEEFGETIGFINNQLIDYNSRHGGEMQMVPTYFEMMTTAAACFFARNEVDFVIWETGMGGRLDATNAVIPEVSIITNIGKDHCQYLGETVSDIAREKAGIIKKDVPVFYGGECTEALGIISAVAHAKGSKYFYRGNDFFVDDFNLVQKHPALQETNFTVAGAYKHAVTTRLWGFHQAENSSLAATVLKYLSMKHGFDFNLALDGMKRALWPGRLQWLAVDKVDSVSEVLIDGCHNLHAAEKLTATLQQYYPGEKWDLFLGILEDKDPIQLIKAIAPVARTITLLPVDNPRSFDPEKTAPVIQQEFPSLDVEVGSLDQLPELLKEKNALITGSLYLIGDIIKRLSNEPIPAIITDER